MAALPRPVPGADKLAAAFGTLRDVMGREAEVQTLIALFLVASEPGIVSSELSRRLDLGGSSISRNVGRLGKTGYGKRGTPGHQPGLGLIDAEPDPDDRRQKPLYLSAAGRVLVTMAMKQAGVG